MSKQRNKKGAGSLWAFAILMLLITGAAFLYFRSGDEEAIRDTTSAEVRILKKVNANYGRVLDSLSSIKVIPKNYCKALIALECSGNIPSGTRFERHVFSNLKRVRDGSQIAYGSIKKDDINDASYDALRNLATSWGPFQLMGYQCMEMDLHVRDIRGKHSVYWGIEWMQRRYGKYLKKGRFKDAFHIHNAGSPYPTSGRPRTFDPRYCEKGLAYMKWFEENSGIR